MKKYISSLILFLLCCTVFAQADSTAATPAISSGNWLADNWEKLFAIAIGVYELIVRHFPTSKNLSILTIIYNIIKFVIPNKNTDNGTHD